MSGILARVMEAERLLAQGKAEQALALAQRLLPKGPGDPGLNSLMVDILLRLGRPAQALFYAERAVRAAPEVGDTHVNLALCLQATGRGAESVAILRRALEVEPGSKRARVALANSLLDIHDAPGAAEVCRDGLKAGPDPQLAASYAGALLALGEIDACVAASREALAAFPDEPNLASGLALAMTYQYGADPREIAAAHRAYGRIMDRLKPPVDLPRRAARDQEKRLRLGIVSPDLRQHSVSFFIEPFLERYDRDRFEVVCYSSTRHPDRVTERLRGLVGAWRDTPDLTDIDLASRIAADGVDIALDLAGHTLGNNLPAFNLRPAPVQVTYCGYPDTTGLSAMDYRVVDAFTDPPTQEVDACATERLWRLDPCFLCYRPPTEAPEPARDPSFPGPVFGSFNAGRKLNPGIVGVWARLLRDTPGSTMLLKSFDFAAVGAGARVRAMFEAAGVDPRRVELQAATPTLAEHLALYERVDVALDAAPYNGTTTTCEALWMGVPVISLAGHTHAGRVGESLLRNVGLPELIAPDEAVYARAARELAASPDRIATYRAALRSRLRSSALCDASGFAARFGSALREMWREACTRPVV